MIVYCSYFNSFIKEAENKPQYSMVVSTGNIDNIYTPSAIIIRADNDDHVNTIFMRIIKHFCNKIGVSESTVEMSVMDLPHYKVTLSCNGKTRRFLREDITYEALEKFFKFFV